MKIIKHSKNISFKNKLLEFAYSKGASLIGVTGSESYNEYLNEVKTRLDETKATHEDYMVTEDALSFFRGLSDPEKTFAELRSIIILGVYAIDKESDYKSTPKELRGKIARTYSYYPVVRSISEQVVEYIKDAGYEAIEGQHVPLKYLNFVNVHHVKKRSQNNKGKLIQFVNIQWSINQLIS